MYDEENICGYDPSDPETWPSGTQETVDVEPGAIGEGDFPRCRRDPLEGHDHCGLHLPIEDRPEGEDEEEFNELEAIAAELRAAGDINTQTTGPRNKVSFVGARFETVDLTELEDVVEACDQILDFRLISVDNQFDVSELTILGGLELDGASIGYLDAHNADFHGDVSLNRVHIRTTGSEATQRTETPALDFSNVGTVDGRLSLNRARIDGSAILSHIDSINKLQAKSAQVKDELALNRTVINSETTLSKLTCRWLSASGATFKQNVTLNRSEIFASADFEHIELGGGEDATQIELGGNDDGSVTLTNISVGGRLNLEHATVHTDAELGQLSAQGETILKSATFVDTLTLTEAQFDDEVRAQEVSVRGPADFSGVTFGETARFDRGSFHGPVTFDGADFGDNCFFRDRVDTDGQAESDDRTDARASVTTTTETAQVRSRETEVTSDGGTERTGIFHSDLSLTNATFEGTVDFRLFEPVATDRLFSPADDIADDAVTVGGNVEATGASLTGANMDGFHAAGSVDLREATLSEATLRDANLTDTNAENATFSHTNLFGATLDGAWLHGVTFEGARIDNETTFGDAVADDRQATETDDKTAKATALTKAISVYSQLETLARENGQMDVARWAFVSRKDAKRVQLRATDGFSVSYTMSLAKKYGMNYGESWKLVIGWSGLTVVIAGIIYPLLDLQHDSIGHISYTDSCSSVPCFFEQAVYGALFSLSSFASMGGGGFAPGLRANVLSTVQAVFGVLMLGLLLFVLQRRTAR